MTKEILNHITIKILMMVVMMLGITTAEGQETAQSTMRTLYPQEKVYVMTDRDLYLAGDTARMRAWVYNCLKRKPGSKSRYVYVELRDAADNLKMRVKLGGRTHKDDKDKAKLFRGYLALPPTLQSGDYTLAAYTYYMIGTDEQLIFKKRLHVMNPKDVKRGLLPRNLVEGAPNGEGSKVQEFKGSKVQKFKSSKVQKFKSSKVQELKGEKVSVPVTEEVDLTKVVPAGSNVAMSITADRLCRADSTSSIVWALEHQPEVFMPSTMPYELGQTISGTVYGNISTKKPQEGVRVSMMVPSKQIANVYVTGKDGRFWFQGFDLPDSAMVLISAKKGKRTQMENITIDSDSLPEVIRHLPASRNYFKRNEEASHDMKIVTNTIDLANTHLLEEITVNGEKKVKVTETYQMLAARTMVADELMDKGIYDLESAIMRMPGVQMVNGVLCYRGKPLRFFVDGFEETADMDDQGFGSTSSMVAMSYPMEVIERIDFVRPEDAAFLTGGAGLGGMAAICITLKSGADLSRVSRSAALKMLFPLGYQRYKKFHAPDPDTPWPVIYWNSNITVRQSEDIAMIAAKHIGKRRKAGDRGSYTVHIDGFTPEGEPIHVEKTFEER